MSRNGVSSILNNPFYMGLIRIEKTNETFPGIHPPLISPSLYQHAQRVLHGRLHARPIKHDFVFRRLLTCAYCGYSLIGETQKGRIYYRCHTPSFHTTSVREDRVEEELQRVFSRVSFTPEEWAALVPIVSRLKQRGEADRHALRVAGELALRQVQDRLNKLVDAYLDGTIDKALFEARKASLLSEQKTKEEARSRADHAETSPAVSLEEFLERTNRLHLNYLLAEPSEKRDLILATTSNRSVTGKNLGIELKNPYLTVSERPIVLNGGPHRYESRTAWRALDRLITKLMKYFTSADAAHKDGEDAWWGRNSPGEAAN